MAKKPNLKTSAIPARNIKDVKVILAFAKGVHLSERERFRIQRLYSTTVSKLCIGALRVGNLDSLLHLMFWADELLKGSTLPEAEQEIVTGLIMRTSAIVNTQAAMQAKSATKLIPAPYGTDVDVLKVWDRMLEAILNVTPAEQLLAAYEAAVARLIETITGGVKP